MLLKFWTGYMTKERLPESIIWSESKPSMQKNNKMPYYFTKTLDRDFDEVIEKVSQALERQGFSILTEIDVGETFRRELGVEFEKYRIFGACNVSHAMVP